MGAISLMRNIIAISCLVVCYWLGTTAAVRSGSTNMKAKHPCATLSCYFNAMCVVDPDSGEPFCECPASECDSYPYTPICAEGITYESPCHVHMHSCNMQKRIKVKHHGPCGETDCGETNPCAYYGDCIDGSCTCKPCLNGSETIDFDIGHTVIEKVCGSNGVIYESECDMKFQSCSSRTVIKLADMTLCVKELETRPPTPLPVDDHLKYWINSFESTGEEIGELSDRISARSFEPTGTCQKFELRGCLLAKHPRIGQLGLYSIVPTIKLFGSPIYKKLTQIGPIRKNVYLSRFESSRVLNGSWIVGSKVGSGHGWLGVSDPSHDPRKITGTWYATTNIGKLSWHPEPTIYLHCVGDKEEEKYSISDCIADEVTGTYDFNYVNLTTEDPLYNITITDSVGVNIESYEPGGRIRVQVHTNERSRRFKTVYLAMLNEDGDCGVPVLKRAKRKFITMCHGQLITRSANRMGRIKMDLIMPPRGCITFRVLLVSVKGNVYYDLTDAESSRRKHLSRTICPLRHTISP